MIYKRNAYQLLSLWILNPFRKAEKMFSATLYQNLIKYFNIVSSRFDHWVYTCLIDGNHHVHYKAKQHLKNTEVL